MSNSDPQFIQGVLVVGGGYAGMHAARAAERAGAAVTVIDAGPDHSFVTRLAAVAGGTAPESDASMPLADLVDPLVVGRVAGVGDGWVRLEDGRTVHADAVVVTTGAPASHPPIPGIERAAGLRTATDARKLRAEIAAASDVVVVGGGASGVQLAAATAYAHPSARVHLVEAGESLLPGLAPALGSNAVRILQGRGVEVHLRTTVDEIFDGGVHTSKGRIPGLVVWVGGFTADASALGLPVTETGRVTVDDDLAVRAMHRTFAAGDIAAHRDHGGNYLPMSAQVAVRAGTVAGKNAARRIRGAQTRSSRFMQLGWVLDLGGRRGLAELGPLPLAAPVLDLVPPLLHDGIDVKNLFEIAGPAAALARVPSVVAGLVPSPVIPSPDFAWVPGRVALPFTSGDRDVASNAGAPGDVWAAAVDLSDGDAAGSGEASAADQGGGTADTALAR